MASSVFLPSAAAAASDPPSDPIGHILAAHQENDLFLMLSLERPSLRLGKCVYDITSEDLGRAYRKASLGVHPDKCGGDPRGREAFDALTAAYRTLRSEGPRGEYLKTYAVKLQREEEKARAGLGREERLREGARRAGEEREQRREEARNFQEEILGQVREFKGGRAG
jgi:DnaJ-class molecular chaperone